MDYREMLMQERACKDMITRFKRQKAVLVRFYLKGRISGYYGCSFAGYKTDKKGLFGIHYDGNRNAYYFGTFYENQKSTLRGLPSSVENRIPAFLKKALIRAVAEKLKQYLVTVTQEE